jgi:Ran GTPase-activating protein (RanGAP) involved in mRNA processing and transport
VLSLKSNKLRADGGKALAAGLKGNQVITELNIADNDLTNYGKDVSGLIALAGVIPDMGGLLSLDMSDNNLGYEEAGQALGDMLATNSTLQQLNLSNCFVQLGSALAANKDRPAKFAQALSVGLRDNGAISLVDLSSNGIGRDGALAICNAFLCRYCALWYWGA